MHTEGAHESELDSLLAGAEVEDTPPAPTSLPRSLRRAATAAVAGACTVALCLSLASWQTWGLPLLGRPGQTIMYRTVVVFLCNLCLTQFQKLCQLLLFLIILLLLNKAKFVLKAF